MNIYGLRLEECRNEDKVKNRRDGETLRIKMKDVVGSVDLVCYLR